VTYVCGPNETVRPSLYISFQRVPLSLSVNRGRIYFLCRDVRSLSPVLIINVFSDSVEGLDHAFLKDSILLLRLCNTFCECLNYEGTISY
jgi:hypothetical protein